LTTQYPPNRITSTIDFTRIYLDENGKVYGYKVTNVRRFDVWTRDFKEVIAERKVEKAYPEDHGCSKTQSMEIYVAKKINSPDQLSDEITYFKMPIKFEIPAEKRYRFFYFTRTRNGKVFLTNLEAGSTSEVGINDKEFCTRGRAIKLKSNTLLRKDAPVFTLGEGGVLERRL
jgi:hypothetical protein